MHARLPRHLLIMCGRVLKLVPQAASRQLYGHWPPAPRCGSRRARIRVGFKPATLPRKQQRLRKYIWRTDLGRRAAVALFTTASGAVSEVPRAILGVRFEGRGTLIVASDFHTRPTGPRTRKAGLRDGARARPLRTPAPW